MDRAGSRTSRSFLRRADTWVARLREWLPDLPRTLRLSWSGVAWLMLVVGVPNGVISALALVGVGQAYLAAQETLGFCLARRCEGRRALEVGRALQVEG